MKWLAVSLTLLMCCCFTPLVAQETARSPLLDKVADVGFEQHLGEQLPLSLQFYDESGRLRPLSYFIGERPVLLLLVYYECPMLCGLELDGLVRSLLPLELTIGQDFDVLTVSFDPREQPDLAARKKKNYIERYRRQGAEQGWHFLTGDPESIRVLTDAVGFRYRYDPDTDQFAHAAGLMVVTPDGELARYFYGIDHPSRDLRLALVEASTGKIGTLTDQVLLLCYQYDPSTGKYGFAIYTAMRVAGVLTLLVIGGGIGIMLRNERRLLRASHDLSGGEAERS